MLCFRRSTKVIFVSAIDGTSLVLHDLGDLAAVAQHLVGGDAGAGHNDQPQHKPLGGGGDPHQDKTVLGDTFSICPLLPKESVDLIIADPPYNLTKSFNGSKFAKKKASDYEEYTRKWLSLVYPLLKPNGSIYVCCDWETSLIIGRVLGDFFKIRSRITWQREKGRGAKANWKNGMEDIWYATKSDVYTFNLDAVKIRKKVIAPYRVDGKPKDWTETDTGNYRDTCPSNFWDDITIPFWSMPERDSYIIPHRNQKNYLLK